MNETFCQICRHPSDDPPGHEPNCPVYTGERQRGWQGISQEDMQAMPQVQGQLGSGSAYSAPLAYGYSDIDPRILVELQDIRAEVRRLEAALEDLRRTVAAMIRSGTST